MNTLKNKVLLMGRLGQDPEVKTVNGKSKLAKFSLATSETYTNAKGEKVKDTQWHNLIAWGKTAEIIEKYCGKGMEVVVEGKLINHNYTDKQDIKRYVTEIQVNEVVIITPKK
ncbi:MAG TPA: single-stranded DNA-binding protein [Chitinophagales bacterium]|nr:single-stranded DNA-binding protein [Chitinophagales bacterium]HMU70163.1 single-stranded DNA-binding protein [Chitinophagales bacterium]HMX05089.1 single-stranded DNA-binding protein [Chitinophagales bacterium]HNA58050.1 single-stranded DNA-binding protein [Chitinophagales bacterium]HNE47225.1 single-stranded DNA-binding protein [Chitinophagales bacterium]